MSKKIKDSNKTDKVGIFERLRAYINRSLKNKTVATGLYVSIVSVIFIAVVIFINLIVTKAEITGDLTSNKMYSITDDTIDFLKDLKDDIIIYYVSKDEAKDSQVYELVKKYEEHSKHIKVVFKDPVIYPTFMKKYLDKETDASSVADNSVVVVKKKDESKFKYIGYEKLVQSEVDYSTGSQNVTGVDVEGQITSAINYVTMKSTKKIYFVTGHDEAESFDANISDLISKKNIETDTIALQTSKKIPKDCDLLAIVSPKSDFTEDEVERVKDYMEKGHPTLITLGYTGDARPNLNSLLAYYGIQHNEGIVIDKDSERHSNQGYAFLFPEIVDHDITSSFGKVYVAMPNATGFTKVKEMPQGITVEPLLQTSEDAYCVTDMTLSAEDVNKKNSQKEQFMLGAASSSSTAGENTKLVAFSSAVAFDGSQNIASGSYANANMLMKAINWLCNLDDTVTLSIPAKSFSQDFLNVEAAQALLWTLLMVIVIPVVILVIGFTVWYRRRRR